MSVMYIYECYVYIWVLCIYMSVMYIYINYILSTEHFDPIVYDKFHFVYMENMKRIKWWLFDTNSFVLRYSLWKYYGRPLYCAVSSKHFHLQDICIHTWSCHIRNRKAGNCHKLTNLSEACWENVVIYATHVLTKIWFTRCYQCCCKILYHRFALALLRLFPLYN